MADWFWIGRYCLVFPLMALLVSPRSVSATRAEAGESGSIDLTQETLNNGLQVIYVPLHQAPVAHVRVIYHVGSRDERPDRQGFAHMFEHMMFRGSAHVAPEEHMKLIGVAGGYSNAFTSFDQTVYHDTLPSNHLEMALYLEADRMASFKVSEAIYKTERKVVAEEWRMRMNRPYGNLFDEFLKNAFTAHSYRWTPIGNMDHLRAARVNELQDFFNTYYLPNNATLVIAGDIDVASTRAMVKKYFGWIPAGPAVDRNIPPEPAQREARQAVVYDRVPLPAIMLGWHIPAYRSEDHEALSLLSDILGSGQSSRLDRLLVNNRTPQAVRAGASEMRLEDSGIFSVDSIVMQGHDADRVATVLAEAVADIVRNGVSGEELEKAKTQERVALVEGRQTATTLAEQIGEEAVFGGDVNRVNTALARLERVSCADVQAVARKYLEPALATTLRVKPDPLGKNARAAAAQALATRASMDVPVAPATHPVIPRAVEFPADYPMHPRLTDDTIAAHFKKGEETQIDGVRVIVMSDSRLPLVNWSLTTRNGSYGDPRGKEGLSALADEMMRHGAAGLSFAQLNEDLESRGITLEAGDGGDYSRISGSCTSPQLEHALLRTRQILLAATFPDDEFRKLQEQRQSELALSHENPMTVAENDLTAALWTAESPLGRTATPESIAGLDIDDVRSAYRRNFDPHGAVLILAGDITVARGRALAAQLLEGWDARGAAPLTIATPPVLASRRIILVDRPGGHQATVRLGIRAYDIHSDDKFAGSIAGQILTAGIDSRLGRYVRAQKGLAYSVHGVFQPMRQSGAFIAATETAVESTSDAIEAMFKVFEDMRSADVTAEELLQAKQRVAGSMVMSMQTIQQQAGYRVDGVLNAYPIDYYDEYPARVGAVQAAQVRDVMHTYVRPSDMVIVVVAPADAVRSQLEKFGSVEVLPMPSQRHQGDTRPTRELLKPTG